MTNAKTGVGKYPAICASTFVILSSLVLRHLAFATHAGFRHE
jgi:hypothetical protein